MKKSDLIAEIRSHITVFNQKGNLKAASRWRTIIDRIEGNGGISDQELAGWLRQAQQYHWGRGLKTLPKAIEFLKNGATEPSKVEVEPETQFADVSEDPPVPEPTDDPVRAIAEEIFTDYVKRAQGDESQGNIGYLAGMLDALGFKDWFIPGHGWLSGLNGNTGRIQRAYRMFQNKPWIDRLKAVGTRGHPKRDLPKRFEWLDRYCRVENGNIYWGLTETVGRDTVFNLSYDFMELIVIDGGEHVAKIQQSGFDHVTPLADHNLTDDDYRFQVGCRAHDWGYAGQWFDMAIVDGKWERLEFQGKNWDGEYSED